VDEKIKKLDAELAKHREIIKKARPGPAQEAAKRRAMQVLKQKRLYEGRAGTPLPGVRVVTSGFQLGYMEAMLAVIN
jgi:hypothetical protein